MHRNRRGMGYVGYCICPKCGNKLLHQAGKPCGDNCRKCGGKMVREGSYHHQLIEEKKKGCCYN